MSRQRWGGVGEEAAALAGIVALAGCAKSGIGKDALPADAGAPSAASVPASVALASGAPGAAPAVPNAFTGAMRGTIDGKHAIVLHLTNVAGVLDGSYYYVPAVDDLTLHGTVTPAGAVHLDESSGGKPTGAFDGHLDSRGTVDGAWADAKNSKSLPFHLDPVHVTDGAPAILVERKRASKVKATKPFDKEQWGQEPVCDLQVTFPDVLGAFTAAEERTIDATFRQNAMEGTGPCEEPFVIGGSYVVRANAAGILSVEQPSNNMAFGMPGPQYGITFTNLSVPSGKPIDLGDILTPAGVTLVEARILAALPADTDADTRAQVKTAIASSPLNFSIERAGLHASVFDQLPHAYQGVGMAGVTVAATDLAGVRRRPSPVDALWGL